MAPDAVMPRRVATLLLMMTVGALALLSGPSSATATIDRIYTLPFYDVIAYQCNFIDCYPGHNGVDYQLSDPAVGGSVVAAAFGRDTAPYGGTVYEQTDTTPGGRGKYIIIDHHNTHMTRYLHLQEFVAVNGAAVARGEVIGREGNTGGPWCQNPPSCTIMASPYHLHFETRVDATSGVYESGTAVNPYASNTYMWQDQAPGDSAHQPNHADFSPAVATWTSSRVDVFVRGKDNDLWRRTRISGSWGSWSRPRQGDCLRSAPGASTWGASGVDMFYRGCDNDLFQVTWNGSQWLEVRPMPGSCLLGAPSATSWGSNRIDVFYRGCDNDLFQATWNGSQWSVIRPMPGSCLRSGPGAVSPPGTTRLEIAYRGCDDGIWRYGYASGAWSGGGLGGCTMSRRR